MIWWLLMTLWCLSMKYNDISWQTMAHWWNGTFHWIFIHFSLIASSCHHFLSSDVIILSPNNNNIPIPHVFLLFIEPLFMNNDFLAIEIRLDPKSNYLSVGRYWEIALKTSDGRKIIKLFSHLHRPWSIFQKIKILKAFSI